MSRELEEIARLIEQVREDTIPTLVGMQNLTDFDPYAVAIAAFDEGLEIAARIVREWVG